MKPAILVLCTGNSCRSQMAHGYLQHFLGAQFDVFSAGVTTHGVNPRAIQVMQEDGIDISGHESTHVDTYLDRDFAYVITVCDHAREACPVFPAKAKQIHRNFTDPAKAEGTEEQIMGVFRQVREEIKAFSREFADNINVQNQHLQ